MRTSGYRLVRLPNGAASIHSLAHGETCHPVVGPAAEAEALYVRHLRIPERVREGAEEFVVWDVGLGGAANALAVLRAARDVPGRLRVCSFDQTLAPLAFALEHAAELAYPAGYEAPLRALLREQRATFANGRQEVQWTVHVADFPAFLQTPSAAELPKPHAILYDPYSPARNPAMWTLPLFADLFRRLDPQRACGLATFSRSTMTRAALLLAGFYVGTGGPVGAKEETTIAANTPALIDQPLGCAWLERARKSSSAEPLPEPAYRQAPLSAATRAALERHPQFAPA